MAPCTRSKTRARRAAVQALQVKSVLTDWRDMIARMLLCPCVNCGNPTNVTCRVCDNYVCVDHDETATSDDGCTYCNGIEYLHKPEQLPVVDAVVIPVESTTPSVTVQ